MSILKKLLNKANKPLEKTFKEVKKKVKEKHMEVPITQVYSYLEAHPHEPLYIMCGLSFLFKLEYIGNNKLNFVNYSQCDNNTKEPFEETLDIVKFKTYKMLESTDRALTVLGIKEVLDGLDAKGL